MSEYILLGVVALLYVLGSYQGSTIADVIEDYLPANMQVAPAGRFVLTWLWPYSTVRAMMENGNDAE